MIAYDVALVFVLTLALVVLVLFVLLLLQREVSTLAAAHTRRREAVLAAFVHRALSDPAATTELRLALRPFDHLFVREMLLRLAIDLRGEEAAHIARLYQDLGLLRRELRRLGGWGWRRRATAATALGTLQTPVALPALLRALEDRHPHVRVAAMHAMGAVGDRNALAGLVPMLGDVNLGVARRAADILAERGREVSGEILAYLGTSGSRAGRQAAVELLGWLRVPKAGGALLRLFGHPDRELRIKAVKAAAAIGDPRCLEPFHQLLGDPSWEVRCHAARGLGLLGSRSSIPWLRARLDDPQWWVRYQAAAALAEMGADGRAALVEARADREPRVADMARYILGRVAPAQAVLS